MELKIFYTILFLLLLPAAGYCNMYFIFYATSEGKTGHTGIAFDTYKVLVRDSLCNDSLFSSRYDTVITGDLIYFDFWPEKDDFAFGKYSKDRDGVFYRLASSSSYTLDLDALYMKGLPHKEGYPCDGIIQLNTSPYADQAMIRTVDSMANCGKKFNARHYNCTDFIVELLETVLKRDFKAKEFIPFTFTSTPNKFYKKICKLDGVRIIKDAGPKVHGSFIRNKVIYSIFNKKTNDPYQKY